jgi:DNA-binding beta-propeller fold protein YncE
MTTGRASIAQVAVAIAALTAAGCSGTAAHEATSPSTSSSGAGATTIASAGGRTPLVVDARYTAKSLGLKDPANLAIGPDGNLYVTDASQRVTVVSPAGKVLHRWGSLGREPGQFRFPVAKPGAPGVLAGITVDSHGLVYVADSDNARVQVFSPTGTFIRVFGSFGEGPGQFLTVDGLVADEAGNVYVIDGQEETLKKFSATGAFQWLIGGNSENDPDLIGHFHLSSSSMDAHGRILLTNDDQRRVFYIDSHGNKVDVIGSPETYPDGACDVTIDQAGYVFVNSCEEPLDSPHYTEVFDRSHHLVGTWYPSPLGWSPLFGPHGEIYGLADDGSILRLRLNLAER